MKAKQLLPRSKAKLFMQKFESLARPAIHRPTNFLTRLKR
jgi:hypothetical protein